MQESIDGGTVNPFHRLSMVDVGGVHIELTSPEQLQHIVQSQGSVEASHMRIHKVWSGLLLLDHIELLSSVLHTRIPQLVLGYRRQLATNKSHIRRFDQDSLLDCRWKFTQVFQRICWSFAFGVFDGVRWNQLDKGLHVRLAVRASRQTICFGQLHRNFSQPLAFHHDSQHFGSNGFWNPFRVTHGCIGIFLDAPVLTDLGGQRTLGLGITDALVKSINGAGLNSRLIHAKQLGDVRGVLLTAVLVTVDKPLHASQNRSLDQLLVVHQRAVGFLSDVQSLAHDEAFHFAPLVQEILNTVPSEEGLQVVIQFGSEVFSFRQQVLVRLGDGRGVVTFRSFAENGRQGSRVTQCRTDNVHRCFTTDGARLLILRDLERAVEEVGYTTFQSIEHGGRAFRCWGGFDNRCLLYGRFSYLWFRSVTGCTRLGTSRHQLVVQSFRKNTLKLIHGICGDIAKTYGGLFNPRDCKEKRVQLGMSRTLSVRHIWIGVQLQEFSVFFREGCFNLSL
ncbi:hypothetical protein D3C87_1125730 [compost metagenome]